MSFSYFKRFRMEIDLLRARLEPPRLPPGYRWVPWHPKLLMRHACVKQASFAGEPDTRIFPALATCEGCRLLMQEISQRPDFVPEATWLLEYVAGESPYDCATIQGLQPAEGTIQNVGVTVGHRGRGLGHALVVQSLLGFQAHGARRVTLEVTARNTLAVRLYRRIGFQPFKTIYRSAPTEESRVY